MSSEVALWLERNNLSVLAPALQREGFDDLEDLKTLVEDSELFAHVVPGAGHRSKLKRLLGALAAPEQPEAAKQAVSEAEGAMHVVGAEELVQKILEEPLKLNLDTQQAPSPKQVQSNSISAIFGIPLVAPTTIKPAETPVEVAPFLPWAPPVAAATPAPAAVSKPPAFEVRLPQPTHMAVWDCDSIPLPAVIGGAPATLAVFVSAVRSFLRRNGANSVSIECFRSPTNTSSRPDAEFEMVGVSISSTAPAASQAVKRLEALAVSPPSVVVLLSSNACYIPYVKNLQASCEVWLIHEIGKETALVSALRNPLKCWALLEVIGSYAMTPLGSVDPIAAVFRQRREDVAPLSSPLARTPTSNKQTPPLTTVQSKLLKHESTVFSVGKIQFCGMMLEQTEGFAKLVEHCEQSSDFSKAPASMQICAEAPACTMGRGCPKLHFLNVEAMWQSRRITVSCRWVEYTEGLHKALITRDFIPDVCIHDKSCRDGAACSRLHVIAPVTPLSVSLSQLALTQGTLDAISVPCTPERSLSRCIPFYQTGRCPNAQRCLQAHLQQGGIPVSVNSDPIVLEDDTELVVGTMSIPCAFMVKNRGFQRLKLHVERTNDPFQTPAGLMLCNERHSSHACDQIHLRRIKLDWQSREIEISCRWVLWTEGLRAFFSEQIPVLKVCTKGTKCHEGRKCRFAHVYVELESPSSKYLLSSVDYTQGAHNVLITQFGSKLRRCKSFDSGQKCGCGCMHAHIIGNDSVANAPSVPVQPAAVPPAPVSPTTNPASPPNARKFVVVDDRSFWSCMLENSVGKTRALNGSKVPSCKRRHDKSGFGPCEKAHFRSISVQMDHVVVVSTYVLLPTVGLIKALEQGTIGTFCSQADFASGECTERHECQHIHLRPLSVDGITFEIKYLEVTRGLERYLEANLAEFQGLYTCHECQFGANCTYGAACVFIHKRKKAIEAVRQLGPEPAATPNPEPLETAELNNAANDAPKITPERVKAKVEITEHDKARDSAGNDSPKTVPQRAKNKAKPLEVAERDKRRDNASIDATKNTPEAKAKTKAKPLETAEQHNNDGNSLYRDGKFLEAAEKYKMAIASCSTNGKYYSNLSAAYFAGERYFDALTEGLNAVRCDQTSSKFYYRCAAAAERMGNYVEAFRYAHTAVELQEDNDTARQILETCGPKAVPDANAVVEFVTQNLNSKTPWYAIYENAGAIINEHVREAAGMFFSSVFILSDPSPPLNDILDQEQLKIELEKLRAFHKKACGKKLMFPAWLKIEDVQQLFEHYGVIEPKKFKEPRKMSQLAFALGKKITC